MKWKPYPEYKDSGVEWLGQVPAHWEVKRLSYLALLKSGDNITSEMIAEGGDYPVYGGNGLRGNYHQFNHIGHYALIGRQGALCGNVNYAIGKFWASEHALVVSPLRKFSVVWMGELLRAMNLGQYSVTAAQPGIAAEMIRGLRIPVPPLPEQTAIAEFLDRETGRIDELVGKKRQLIERVKEKRSALISRTVTRGLPADLPPETLARLEKIAGEKLPLNPPLKPSGIDWLGDVPVHWDLKRLSYLATLQSGENITSEMIAEGGDYPVYGGNGYRGNYHKFTHSGNFVLIGRQGALCGNINYAIGKFWASEHALVVTPLTVFEVTWLGELLRAMNLGQYSITAAQPGISAEVIRALRIPIPPLPEQTAIAAYLDEETTKIDDLIAKVETAIERLQEYRSALITAAVTGKIDVREAVGGKRISYPESEPALQWVAEGELT